jgi:Cytochrome P460
MQSFSLRVASLLATAVVVGVGLVAALLPVSSGATKAATFSPYVDEQGNISVPAGYRSQWAHLGTWSVREKMGGLSYHEVYTQPSAVEAYQQTGVFPDGAVLVKELRKTTAAPLTTGHVTWGAEITGWFVMIKDATGRFKGHHLWGDGWGWALFQVTPEDPQKRVTQDYKTECIPCHIPARQTDWVYIQGYPELRETSTP